MKRLSRYGGTNNHIQDEEVTSNAFERLKF